MSIKNPFENFNPQEEAPKKPTEGVESQSSKEPASQISRISEAYLGEIEKRISPESKARAEDLKGGFDHAIDLLNQLKGFKNYPEFKLVDLMAVSNEEEFSAVKKDIISKLDEFTSMVQDLMREAREGVVSVDKTGSLVKSPDENYSNLKEEFLVLRRLIDTIDAMPFSEIQKAGKAVGGENLED